MIIDKLEEAVVGSPTMAGAKKIYDTQPVILWGEYFSHGVIFDYSGRNGFSLITMVQHNRLPKGFT